MRGVNAVDLDLDLDPGEPAGATVTRVLRTDAAFYDYDVTVADLRHASRFSITPRQDPVIRAAIAGIDPQAWRAIKYTHAVYEADQHR